MADLPVLDAEEQRVLGALLEKERTVPASYPMTLGALRNACNQTSNREPVVDYDESGVGEILKRLRPRELVRVVWAATGRRTLKYHQVLAEHLALDDDERALLTVLLLRGPQAPGELRTRSDRLHTFADRGQVEACLTRLAQRPDPLVEELPRRSGQQDARWVHLLGPVDAAVVTPAATDPVDRESVLAAGGAERDARVRSSYDAVAMTYADRLVDELQGLPFETWLLDRVAAHVVGGPVVEAGCGPGHVTAYLAAAGADAFGIDLSPGMVAEARRRFPDGSYEVGDLRTLIRPVSAPGWSAVLGWYSLVHLSGSELPGAVAALVRPLAPGGLLVLGMHAGAQVRHNACWFDVPVDLDFVMHDPETVAGIIAAAGLVDVEWYHRGPLTHRGETTQRLYVVARRPD